MASHAVFHLKSARLRLQYVDWAKPSHHWANCGDCEFRESLGLRHFDVV